MLYLIAEENVFINLNTVHEFYQISVLTINMEKNKIIKIEVSGDSRIIFCSEGNLIWTQEFVSLAYTCTL